VRDSSRLIRAGTRDTIAHELFLRARTLHFQYGESNLRQAIALYRKASARDPAYAEAWASEGAAWFNLADEYIAPRDANPHLREAASRAIAIDSSHAQAQLLLAAGLQGRIPLREMAARARRAAAAAPNDVLVQLFGGLIVGAVDPAGGAAIEARARALDPLSGITAMSESMLLYYAGRMKDAERVAREAVALAPELGFAHAALGQALLRQGKNAEALAAYREGLALGDRDMSAMGAGIALARLGRTAEARRILETMERDARTRYVIGDWVARLCLELGERDAALTWLERAAEEGSNYTRFIDADPHFDPLRGDPRFEAVRRRIGLVAR
jgi:tetratricopeptide (TPR) repeat protein